MLIINEESDSKLVLKNKSHLLYISVYDFPCTDNVIHANMI